MDRPRPPRPAIVVHAGAWAIPEDERASHRDGCMTAIRLGWASLEKGTSAVNAVVETVSALEDDDRLNAGTGSVLNRDGIVELDAGIMCGTDLSVGGVAAIRNRQNPIQAANAVRQTSHVLLCGPGAESFLDECGVPTCDPARLVVSREVARLDAWRQRTDGDDHGVDFGKPGAGPGDTVGAIAIDTNGRIAVAVSTGGICGKRSGRIGDTPVPGAGYYADNALGGAVCTGWGESLLRMGAARRAVEHLREYAAQDAAWLVIRELEERFGGKGGLIVIGRDGSIGFSYNTPQMAVAYMDAEIIDPVIAGGI
jgi:beta-aspartyl-peptidase (threonine type)